MQIFSNIGILYKLVVNHTNKDLKMEYPPYRNREMKKEYLHHGNEEVKTEYHSYGCTNRELKTEYPPYESKELKTGPYGGDMFSTIIIDILNSEKSFGFNILSNNQHNDPLSDHVRKFHQSMPLKNNTSDRRGISSTDGKNEAPEGSLNGRIPFTEEETDKLGEGIVKYGRGQWSKILEYGRGVFHVSRTGDSLRMRANTVTFKRKFECVDE